MDGPFENTDLSFLEAGKTSLIFAAQIFFEQIPHRADQLGPCKLSLILIAAIQPVAIARCVGGGVTRFFSKSDGHTPSQRPAKSMIVHRLRAEIMFKGPS
jgi:hypothetical protein